jgi:penicillin-binding protein 2
VRFVEVDARGRVVSESGLARQDLMPEAAPPLRTSIDLDLQRFVVELFGDSLIGGAMVIEPNSGEVLALHSAPTYDPNRFIGGIPASYWDSLNTDARRPLYNKVIQGRYPPASTWKLATSVIALQEKLVRPDERMPVPCSGGYQFGSRYFRCWDRRGHGNVNLTRAIEMSCDVYFYQLGLKMGLSRLIAGGVNLDFGQRSGIDLPDEARPRFPDKDYRAYYNKMYGARGWTSAVTLNLSIGQGENAQTVANMARFYTALATDGTAAKPEIVRRAPQREQLFKLSAADMDVLRAAMAGVVSQGTARASAIQGLTLAGKTGTAQNSHGDDHAWFVGFAPANDPKIVVSVMLEFGEHGSRAARIASSIVAKYFNRQPTQVLQTEGE